MFLKISTTRNKRISGKGRRAQTTMDYAVLLAAVAAAFVATTQIINQVVQGRTGQIQDYVAEKYEPRYTDLPIPMKGGE